MPIYEFDIAIADHPQLTGVSDSRKRKNDIVNALEYTRKYGRKVIDEYLIFPTMCSLIAENIRFLKTVYYESGLIEGSDFRDIEPDDKVVLDPTTYVWNLKTQSTMPRPAKLSKNRFKVDDSLLTNTNKEKLEDPLCIYQPFVKRSDIVKYWLGNMEKPGVKRYRLIKRGNRFFLKKEFNKQRKIYEETINDQVIRFIRRNEPAIYTPSVNEPEYEIFCDEPGMMIAQDGEVVQDWDVEKIVEDKHTKLKLLSNQLGGIIGVQ